MIRPGVDGLTLIAHDSDDDGDRDKPPCSYCGQEETERQHGEIITDPYGDPVHVACLTAARRFACPECGTEWSCEGDALYCCAGTDR